LSELHPHHGVVAIDLVALLAEAEASKKPRDLS
jgi:hypothetical protein